MKYVVEKISLIDKYGRPEINFMRINREFSSFKISFFGSTSEDIAEIDDTDIERFLPDPTISRKDEPILVFHLTHLTLYIYVTEPNLLN